MRVALYARVSTKKDTQNPDTQILSCKRYAEQNDHQIIDTYIDRKSGRNINRPDFIRMMKDALYRRFDMLIVFKMDRLSRGGITETLNLIRKLKGYGVTIHSITEPYLNTDSPTSELVMAVMSWASQMESIKISERVLSGIERWEKEHGKRWKSKEWDINKAIELRKKGMGWRSIEVEMRKDGYDITYAGIRKELLKRGFEKGDNLPSKKPTDEENNIIEAC
jgi:DNA invertase Pin-like site-specific DNA recombinase